MSIKRNLKKWSARGKMHIYKDEVKDLSDIYQPSIWIAKLSKSRIWESNKRGHTLITASMDPGDMVIRDSYPRKPDTVNSFFAKIF